MAEKTINQLAVNGTLDGTELIPIWQSSTTVKLTIDDLGTYLGVGGATTWGSISGTLSSQTDLQAELDAKQPDIQFKDEGSNIGTAGGVTNVNFVGAGVTATHSAGTVTVTIPGGSGGSGTVTSVGLSMPSFFSVANSPITSSGTISVTVTDPNADRIVFWDDSAGGLAYGSVGTGLSWSGTELQLSSNLQSVSTGLTAAGLALIDDASASAQRTTLGLGTWATKNQTVSTSAPSGTPADGDVWLVYTP